MKVVLANITERDGKYYCKYDIIDKQINLLNRIDTSKNKLILDSLNIFGTNELKDGFGSNFFLTLHDITMTLKEQFPFNNVIITKDRSLEKYYSSMLFEEYYITFNELTNEQKGQLFDFFKSEGKSIKELVAYVFSKGDDYLLFMILDRLIKNEDINSLKNYTKNY